MTLFSSEKLFFGISCPDLLTMSFLYSLITMSPFDLAPWLFFQIAGYLLFPSIKALEVGANVENSNIGCTFQVYCFGEADGQGQHMLTFVALV